MKNLKNVLIIMSIIIIILLLVIRLFYSDDIIEYNSDKFNLHEHGIKVFKNILNNNEVDEIIERCNHENYNDFKKTLLHNTNLLKLIRSSTTDNHIFQDYIWIIKKSVVHTCHRDNNGDFFNDGQLYPSYTMLLYLEDMPSALGFIPKSHIKQNKYTNSFNLANPLTHVSCKKGTAILFNANLIHVGTIDDAADDHIRVQMKITHNDDRVHINYYENFHKVLNTSNTIPKWVRKVQKNVSCMMPIISDIKDNTNVSYIKGTHIGYKIGIIEKIFSSMYYGNATYYDLPNVY
jgi:hypothetical protein